MTFNLLKLNTLDNTEAETVSIFHFRLYWLLQFTKRFRKIWLESKWNMVCLVVPAENFRKQRNIDKVDLFFWTECSKRKFVFHFFKAIFVTEFQAFAVVFR